MNENKLFDDIARTLASPIPRRQAFGHILRGIAGAALVSVFGPEPPGPRKPVSGRAGGHVGGKVLLPARLDLLKPMVLLSVGPVFLRQSLLPERLDLLQCDGATGLCCGPGQTCDGKKVKNQYIGIHASRAPACKGPRGDPIAGCGPGPCKRYPRLGSRSAPNRQSVRARTKGSPVDHRVAWIPGLRADKWGGRI